MIFKIGQIYRDTGKPNNPDDQFSRWITPPDGPSIRLVGGIRSQAYAHAQGELNVPANVYLISTLTDTTFAKPWVNVVDYATATVEYWGDAKPDPEKKIDDFTGNKALLRALDGKSSGVGSPPFLCFSRIAPGQLRFDGLCEIERIEAKEVISELGAAYKNYLVRLTILDATEVSANWLRDRAMNGPNAGESAACPEAWRDLRNGLVRKIDAAKATDLNPILPSRTNESQAQPIPDAYLLTWNPDTWDWKNLKADVAAIRRGKVERSGTGATRWSCSNNKSIKRGARFFLLKQGAKPRGIVASGWVSHDSYQDGHWDAERLAKGDTTMYVDLYFDALLDPDIDPPLDVTGFIEQPLTEVNWRAQKSGISIEPSEAVPAIEAAWESHLCGLNVEKLPPPDFANHDMRLAFHAGVPEGISRDDVLDAIADLDVGIAHDFGPSTTYDLLHDGKRYPPKAVLGLAARRLLGRPLDHSEFKGGAQTQCFKILGDLGFKIIPKKQSAPEHSPRWWVLSAGKGGSSWNEFQEQGIAAIGFGIHEDLEHYSDKESISEDIRGLRGPDLAEPVNASLALWQFSKVVAIGDYIVAKVGKLRMLGVGIVESDYFFDATRAELPHVRKVKWHKSLNLVLPKESWVPLKTLTDITDFHAVVDLVKEAILDDEPQAESVPVERFTVDDAMKNLFMLREQLENMLTTWKRKKNLLVQGPPGVGKTFVARSLAYALMGAKDKKRMEMVQFHQSYAYEDFVQGYRPAPKGEFELRNGVFYEFCNRARMDISTNYVFIIDEINRGNLSRIFGELMMLIEPDKRGPEFAIPLTYSDPEGERFSIPENLYLLGMMNTADRSLAMVDYALRRRFAFVTLEPQFGSEAFELHLLSRGAEKELVKKLVDRMTALNSTISEDHKNLGPGFVIGHSFFCPVLDTVLDDAWYRAIIETEVAPLVREYWCDGRDKANKIIADLLKP